MRANLSFLDGPYGMIALGTVLLILGEVGRCTGKVLVPKAWIAERTKDPFTFWFSVCCWYFLGAVLIGLAVLKSGG